MRRKFGYILLIYRGLCSFFSLVGLITFTASFAWAQARPPAGELKADHSQQSFVVENYITKVAFENDGSETRDTSARIRIQSQAGVQRFGLLTFQYQSSVESIGIDYVRVRKSDGAVVETPPESIQDMAASITEEAPSYSDLREKHVAVKGLGTGDVVEYDLHWDTTKPMVAGQFWFNHNFWYDGIVLREVLQISVPNDRAIKFKSPEVKPEIAEDDPRRVYTWTKARAEERPPKEDEEKLLREVGLGLLPSPDVQLSSFQSWEEVGRWYDKLQHDRIQPSPEILAKAAELTRNATDNTTKLRAIYNYVSTQFRYIGVSFGIGRYQPHSAAEVLSNQYGDCKDKHTLLAALLLAAGIKAYPALISSIHTLDVDVPSPGQFDHVISAVPQGKDYLWLDTTREVAPFGYLLSPLRHKPALVVADDRPLVFLTTPANSPYPSSETFRIDAKLDEAGTLEGKIVLTERGDNEVPLRAAFRRVPQSEWKDLIQVFSYGSRLAGSVSDIAASSPEATDGPFRFSYGYNRKEYPDWGNHRLLSPLPPFGLPSLKDDNTTPSQPILLGTPNELRFESRVELPKGYTPDLPKAVDIDYDFAEYHASYALDNGIMATQRRLVVKQREVPMSRYLEYKSFQKQVEDDEHRYIEMKSGEHPPCDAPQPTVVHKVDTHYPVLARQARIQGDVVLEAVIGKDGEIESLRALSGHPFLIPPAIEAVKQWRYTPCRLNGQPVQIETKIEVAFSLSEHEP